MSNFINLHDSRTGEPIWLNMDMIEMMHEEPATINVYAALIGVRTHRTYQVSESVEEIFKKMEEK